ncbi:GTPase-activating protein GYP5 [Tolypocladium paradoxum]|uniref:GTPase-activating protein GYP5 n=1 Tax=Tolypocladium paradoxum TaxID=94208 RepID=A0A2S4KQ34_9HYPO|nr:GTPase-activating protein GYP5 [Tolypocladium paradoxum]
MSQQGGDAASPAHPSHGDEHARPSSAAESDQDTAAENDSFEDAVDAVSVRSLTKRSVSASKSPPPDKAAKPGAHTVKDESPDPAEADPRPQSRRGSSPISSRISNASNLDNVNLDDEAPAKSQGNNHLRWKPQSPADNKDQSSKTLSLSSITSALPSMPWSPPAEPPAKSPGSSMAAVASPLPPAAAHPPPPTRRLTSPFSWLSRNSSSKDKDSQVSPPTQASPRRNTASSIATLTSNPEMMLSRLEEENEGTPNGVHGSNRESLRDRFKALRLREEACIVPVEGDNDKPGGALGLVNQGEAAPPGDKAQLSPVPGPNNGLAPGTMSGVNAGPSAMPDTQVDWDLWQSVVYEGPAAVARTSAEELNKAIATGIPNAIRGVIWQVLSQSKNDDLEVVYAELAARGTDKDKDRHSNSTTASSTSNGNLSAQTGDAVTSSASSVHSEQSTANGSSSPKGEKSAEAIAKAQASATAERKKKEKQDTVALQKLEKTIRRDLGARTSYSKYAAAAGLQEGLFGVCKAYALFDEGVGYAQGMNFLIMPLLFNMPEQEAFCLLVRLMNHYHLRDLFIQDMPGLHMHLYQFERLLEDVEPALYCHLHRRGISPHLYATQWFLTLFAYRFPLQLVLRIYDLILSEGLSAILRFGIVLMQKNATTLLSISDMQQLTTYLKDKLFDVYIDKDPSQGRILENGFFGSSSSNMDKEVYRADQLVRDACEVKITPESLKMYTTEWEEKTKSEKSRETQLQELRMANQNYAVQVRRLEERVEVCDREQAALATEMVHTKVENEELRDENESLKGQVRELKVVIEKQPAEIEETWKLERDDLMKRNEKVHEENQKLEKELAELEEELVQTKMQYAEINSQHETLTRKWSDLRRQFA